MPIVVRYRQKAVVATRPLQCCDFAQINMPMEISSRRRGWRRHPTRTPYLSKRDRNARGCLLGTDVHGTVVYDEHRHAATGLWLRPHLLPTMAIVRSWFRGGFGSHRVKTSAASGRIPGRSGASGFLHVCH